jgi:hypothetical protein
MLPVRIDHAGMREVALGKGVRALATDLRLIDLADLVAYLKTGQIESAGALVQASIELSFKPDTLSFAYSGDVNLHWDEPPQVSFDLEFHHKSVHVYFRLLIEAQQAGVEINYISFDDASPSPETNTQRLVEALYDAQMARAATAEAPPVYY